VSGAFDMERVRADFPVLRREVADRPVVYFDNAATSLKPQPVIDAVVHYMSRVSANIHRGRHLLSEEASEAFDAVREKVARFFNAQKTEVIFVRGATEAINLVAHGLSLKPGDNVVGTILEHHSNILPWSSRCQLRAARLDEHGLPDLAHAAELIDESTRLITVTASSNVTGVIVPVERWAALARERGVPLLVDAAQAAAHHKLDVRALDCDFLVCSGHKMLAPTGVGVLVGKQEQLERLSPLNTGGGTVSLVRDDFTYVQRDLPWRLEAGTPDIAGVLGLAAAIDYLERIGFDAIERQNRALTSALDAQLGTLEGLTFLRPAAGVARTSMLSFVEDTHTLAPDYFSRILSDSFGIMVRGGHQCAHPLHHRLGVPGSLRVSLQFYNTEEEIVHLRDALEQTLRMFVSRAPRA
jgi:cysteine desulfurase/selenocysteine lyase